MGQGYPLQAPRVRFVNRIYHLNVGYCSGEVRMPVLEDDWSPFLTLMSVIESLDQILTHPEENYAVEEAVLEMYQLRGS